MLERFLGRGFNDLSNQQKLEFKNLLEEQDLDLLEWFTGKSVPDSTEYQALVSLIRAA